MIQLWISTETVGILYLQALFSVLGIQRGEVGVSTQHVKKYALHLSIARPNVVGKRPPQGRRPQKDAAVRLQVGVCVRVSDCGQSDLLSRQCRTH